MVYLPQGQSVVVTIPAYQSVRVGAMRGAVANVMFPLGVASGPLATVSNTATTFGPYNSGTTASIVAALGTVEYSVGLNPLLADEALENLYPQPIILAQSAIPMILPSSGTMGANGALTGLTALPYSAFPQPCFMYFPAGKVFSGSPAGMYFASILTTTTAQVYNKMYTSGRPQDAIPAVPTPVVDAGPGAYTQTTGTDITVTSYLLPGGMLGLNGMIRQSINAQVNNNANTKILRAYYGASIYGFQSLASMVSVGVSFAARNRGVANSQFRLASAGVGASGFAWGGAGSTGAMSDNISVNSAVDQQVSTTCNLATATDYICVDAGCIEILPG